MLSLVFKVAKRTSLNLLRKGLPQDQLRFLESYLSPNTDGVHSAQLRVPDGTTLLTYAQSKQWHVDCVPDASGNLVILMLPFVECPFAILDTATNVVKPLQDPTLSQDHLSERKMYAFRHTSQAMTIYNMSPPLSVGGSVTATIMPPFIDVKRNPTTGQYHRILDSIPMNLTEMSSGSVAPYRGQASAGLYMVNRNVNGWGWNNRYAEWEKAKFFPLKTDNTVDRESPKLNLLGYSTASSTDPVFFSPQIGVSGSNGSGFGVGIAWFSGLPEGSRLLLKCFQSVEMLPKFHSPDIGQCGFGPSRNDNLLKGIAEYLRVSPVAYSAKDNAAGAILAGFLKFLPYLAEIGLALAPTAIEWVSGWLEGKKKKNSDNNNQKSSPPVAKTALVRQTAIPAANAKGNSPKK